MKIKKWIHDVFDLPIYENQFQKDIGYWMDYTRFKINRREIYKALHSNRKNDGYHQG